MMNNRLNLTINALLPTLFTLAMAGTIQADGLDITLNEKEQALLNSVEQKQQAESLINLMNTIERLTNYPEDAIDELTGDGPNHQILKRVIRSLKDANEKKATQSAGQSQLLAETQAALQKATRELAESRANSNCGYPMTATGNLEQPNSKPNQISTSTDGTLTPVFAIAKSANGITEGKVIFRTSAMSPPISVSEGHVFVHNGQQHRLLSVTPQSSASGLFNISIETPSATKQYNWPK